MNRLLAGGLGWSLSWLAAAGLVGQGPQAMAAGPVVIAQSPQQSAAPGVTLGQPQALGASAKPQAAAQGAIQQTVFAEPAAHVVRGHSAEPTSFAAPDAMELGELHHSSTLGSEFASEARVASAGGAGFAPEAGPFVAPLPITATLPPPPPPHAMLVNAAPPPGMMVSDAGNAGCGLGPCDACCESCCDCCGCCVDGHRLWFRAEYLLWWIRAPQYPVLAATGPLSSQGILGNPGTVVLFGGDRVPYDPFSGGRFTFGYWCDPCQQRGFEVSGFFLGQQSNSFVGNSSQFPLLTRPFFNINNGREDSQITAAPGIATGVLSIKAPARLWGAEVDYRQNLCCGCNWRLDGLAGVRYLDFEESVNITEDVNVLIADPFRQPGDHAIVFDDFGTRNQFYGGQVGLDLEGRYGRWVFNFRPKIALGVTEQTININGGQLVTRVNGTQQAFVGGLLALPSNIGSFQRGRFSVVPEIGFNVGYQITDNLTAYVGYTLLYWTNVVRAGDQIDRVLDINQIPNFRGTNNPPAPSVHPIVPFRESSFWAQGVNVGLEYRY